MKYLVLLLSLFCLCACVHAQTKIPGPVYALPDDTHTTPNGVCGLDKTAVYSVCLVAESSGISANRKISVNDNAYTFDTAILISGNIVPTVNNSYSLGFLPSNQWLQIGVQNSYNYSANFMTMFNNQNGLAFATGVTGGDHPIQFYTSTSVLRGQFDATGLLVSNLSGTGTRAACATSSGYFTIATCSANGNLAQQCGSVLTLNGSYQHACTGLTINATGTWLVTGSLEVIISSPIVSGIMYVDRNGTAQTSFAFATLARAYSCSASCPTVTDTVAATVSQTWVLALNSGDTINLDMIQSGSGTSQVNGGNFSATFLHP